MHKWRFFINEDWRGVSTNINKNIFSKVADTISSVPEKVEKTSNDYNNIIQISKKFYNTSHLPQDPSPRSPKQQREFRDIIDYKRDAFRHILANTWFASQGGFSDTAMRLAGQTVEFAGAVSNFIKGRGFQSDKEMDLKNNELGLRLSKKILPGTDLNTTAKEVKRLIDRGNYFVEYKGEILLYRDLDKKRPPPQHLKELLKI